MEILDGKKIANDIKQEIADAVKILIKKGCRAPHLCAILVGKNGASETYVSAKVKACARVGFKSSLIRLSEEISVRNHIN